MKTPKTVKIFGSIISVLLIIVFIIVIKILFNNYSTQNNKEALKDSSVSQIMNEITASSVASSNRKGDYYGILVDGYVCTYSEAVNAWKIFYIDENNIYLIADDYISYNYCPSSATQSITMSSPINLNYVISMENVVNDYSGSENILNEKLRKLNSSYFNQLSYDNNNLNMKAVSYLLDTNIWSVYAGEKAEYAIGGPSIEMFLKSYSEKHGVDYQAKSDQIGYRISNDGGLTWDSDMSDILDTADNLYVINSNIKAYGMWLTSPSCYAKYYIMLVGYHGRYKIR